MLSMVHRRLVMYLHAQGERHTQQTAGRACLCKWRLCPYGLVEMLCFCVVFWCLVFLGGVAHAAPPNASVASKPATEKVKRAKDTTVTLNFRDVEVELVVGAFGHLLDRLFMVDPRVKGKITLETPRPVTRVQAYRLLQGVLRAQGFATVESGGLTRIVPEADAKAHAGSVQEPFDAAKDDQMATQIFHLQYELAAGLIAVLRPLIAPNGAVAAHVPENSLVITDYANNLVRIGKIVRSLDRPSDREIDVVPLSHAIAEDLAPLVLKMMGDDVRGGATTTGDSNRLVITPDIRSNSVVVRSSHPGKRYLANKLIAQLDQPDPSAGNVHVIYLRNAEASKLAKTLARSLGVQGGESKGAPATFPMDRNASANASNTEAGSSTPSSSDPLLNSLVGTEEGTSIRAPGALIAADPATNSLIVTASDPVYRNLRSVIDKLDTRRAQVFIESVIVEISAENVADLGIQWQFLNVKQGRTLPIGGTSFAQGSSQNIHTITNNIAATGDGLSVGLVRGAVNLPGVGQVLNLGALVTALASSAQTNILATPNLLTLDNEEARIIIGQNVPFVTGQFLPSSSTPSTPFQTIERRDVGTMLRVRPQVSESGTIRLKIFQEVSNVAEGGTKEAGLITNRRAIESNVLVDDGQVIVLGGLIENRVVGSVEKVPGLGDIPILGQLFRYDKRRAVKTNLLVFLRPMIVRDGEEANRVTASRYGYAQRLQREAQPEKRWPLPNSEEPMLEPLPLPEPARPVHGRPWETSPDAQAPPVSLSETLSPEQPEMASEEVLQAGDEPSITPQLPVEEAVSGGETQLWEPRPLKPSAGISVGVGG